MKTHGAEVPVGLGPVGSVAALQLAQQGIVVTAIEAHAGRGSDLRASTFPAPTIEILHAMGNAHTLRQQLMQLDDDDIDAIVRVGTNLSMVALAAQAEAWLGKPVIAINTATCWHALRARGIEGRIAGFGQLLAQK